MKTHWVRDDGAESAQINSFLIFKQGCNNVQYENNVFMELQIMWM